PGTTTPRAEKHRWFKADFARKSGARLDLWWPHCSRCADNTNSAGLSMPQPHRELVIVTEEFCTACLLEAGSNQRECAGVRSVVTGRVVDFAQKPGLAIVRRLEDELASGVHKPTSAELGVRRPAATSEEK